MWVFRAREGAALNPRDVLALARQRDVKLLRLHFCDLDGSARVVRQPVGQLSQAMFDSGVELDQGLPWGRSSWLPGSVRLLPDAATAILDPFASVPTLNLLCSVWDAERGEVAAADARHMLRRAVDYVAGWGRADQVWMGCSLGGWLVPLGPATTAGREVACRQLQDLAVVEPHDAQVDLAGQATPPRAGAFYGGGRAVEPEVQGAAWRGTWEAYAERLVVGCVQAGLPVQDYALGECEHGWIRLRTTVGDPLAAADAAVALRMLADQLAMQLGLQLVHTSPASHPHLAAAVRLGLTSGGDCLMSGSGYGGLSDLGSAAVAGLIYHAPTLGGRWPIGGGERSAGSRGDAAPRLQVGYSMREPVALVRVLGDSTSPAERQLELQTVQLDANPHWLAVTSLMAMIDGVQSRRSPGQPLEFPQPNRSDTDLQSPRALAAVSEVSVWDYLFRGDILESAWLESALRGLVPVSRNNVEP